MSSPPLLCHYPDEQRFFLSRDRSSLPPNALVVGPATSQLLGETLAPLGIAGYLLTGIDEDSASAFARGFLAAQHVDSIPPAVELRTSIATADDGSSALLITWLDQPAPIDALVRGQFALVA